jgi:uncharacterized protein YjiS (DUF1127 family)
MQIIERLQGDRISSKLEPSVGAGPDGSRAASSRTPFRRTMSWLATATIEGFAAAGQAMYPVCPITDQVRGEDAEPALQAFRQAELGSDPTSLHSIQSWSFGDLLAMEEVSPASFGWNARVRSRVVRLWSAICRARRMRRAVAELEALDDCLLKDIGIHRFEIESNARYGNFHVENAHSRGSRTGRMDYSPNLGLH